MLERTQELLALTSIILAPKSPKSSENIEVGAKRRSNHWKSVSCINKMCVKALKSTSECAHLHDQQTAGQLKLVRLENESFTGSVAISHLFNSKVSFSLRSVNQSDICHFLYLYVVG